MDNGESFKLQTYIQKYNPQKAQQQGLHFLLHYFVKKDTTWSWHLPCWEMDFI